MEVYREKPRLCSSLREVDVKGIFILRHYISIIYTLKYLLCSRLLHGLTDYCMDLQCVLLFFFNR